MGIIRHIIRQWCISQVVITDGQRGSSYTGTGVQMFSLSTLSIQKDLQTKGEMIE